VKVGRALAAGAILAGACAGCAGRHHQARSATGSSTSAPPATPATSSREATSITAPPASTASVATTAVTGAQGGRAVKPGASTTASGGGTTAARPQPAGPTIAGCNLFPADNPWRRDVSADPLDPHSGAWVASVGAGTHLHPDFGSNPTYGIPYVVVPAGQAKVPITFTAYGDESDPGPYPVPQNAPVEAGSDRHVLLASDDCHLYEMFDASPDGHGGWNAGSGAVFDLGSNRLRPDTWTSADAAGLPILPDLVRWDEVQAGRIDHALRFTVAHTQKGFVHPATHQAGSTSDPNVPPMGARFRLKPSFDISGFHGAARVVLECLRRYGMFVADNGSNWFISGSTDTRWNDDDLNQLKTVPGSAFEAVATGAVLH
jgi:hypothetical protein